MKLHFTAMMLFFTIQANGQCVSNGMTMPTYLNIVVWNTQDFEASFATPALARQAGMDRLSAALATPPNGNVFQGLINQLNIHNTGLTPRFIFAPLQDLANPKYAPAKLNGEDFSGWAHDKVIPQFVTNWPCLKYDLIIVNSLSGISYKGQTTDDGKVCMIRGYTDESTYFYTAHEIGHALGLDHTDIWGCSMCSTNPTFMCSGESISNTNIPVTQVPIKFSLCDISKFDTDVFNSIHCTNWMDFAEVINEGTYVCPTLPQLAITADQKYIIKGCGASRETPMFTVTIKGGQGGTNGIKVRAKYRKIPYDIDLATQGLDFNAEESFDQWWNILRRKKIVERKGLLNIPISTLPEGIYYYFLDSSGYRIPSGQIVIQR